MRCLAPPFITALLIAVGVVGCGGRSNTEAVAKQPEPAVTTGDLMTAEEAFEALRRVAVEEDWEALYDLVPPSKREAAERRWEAALADEDAQRMFERIADALGVRTEELKRMAMREMFARMVKVMEENPGHQTLTSMMTEAELTEVDVKDDHATLAIESGDLVERMSFVRENGRWWFAAIDPGNLIQ